MRPASFIKAAATACAMLTATATAAPLDVQQAMRQAERLMIAHGIPVEGYAQTAPPPAERVAPSHIYLQGNDGAYAAGRIYLSTAAIEDCQGLILLHELVHDATVKFRLFQSASNHEVRALIEALADRISAEAAQDPYRPGCLPRRRFEFSVAELAVLAAR
jgi:hypothetical protein